MDLAGLVIVGLLGLICLSAIAGFVDAWLEQRKRDKDRLSRR